MSDVAFLFTARVSGIFVEPHFRFRYLQSPHFDSQYLQFVPNTIAYSFVPPLILSNTFAGRGESSMKSKERPVTARRRRAE